MDRFPIGTQPENISEWFWTGNNGNLLINQLNAHSRQHKIGTIVRKDLEMNAPRYYCVVINGLPANWSPGYKAIGYPVWKLCKIGFTSVDTAFDSNNRMEQVAKKIEDFLPGAQTSTLWVLPKRAIDVRKNTDVEKQIRQKMGFPLLKRCAESLGLPFPTEWVLTTQAFINIVVNQKKLSETAKVPLTSEMFNSSGLWFHYNDSPAFPSYFELNKDGKVDRRGV